MDREINIAQRLGSLKDPTEILSDVIQFGIRVPLTPAQFALLKDSPLGLIQRICGNWVTEVMILKFIQHNQLLEELNLLFQAEMNIPNITGVSDNEDEVDEETQILSSPAPTIKPIVDTYSEALSNYYQALGAYDTYVRKIPDEWHDLHVKQVKTSLAPAVNHFLADQGLASLKSNELSVIHGVAKPAEILARSALWEGQIFSDALSAEALSMPKPTPENVGAKVEVNLNIALLRILTARDQNTDPQKLDTVLPSVVKKWQSVGLGDVITRHTTACEGEDANLFSKQQKDLAELGKKIENLKETVITEANKTTLFHAPRPTFKR